MYVARILSFLHSPSRAGLPYCTYPTVTEKYKTKGKQVRKVRVAKTTKGGDSMCFGLCGILCAGGVPATQGEHHLPRGAPCGFPLPTRPGVFHFCFTRGSREGYAGTNCSSSSSSLHLRK